MTAILKIKIMSKYILKTDLPKLKAELEGLDMAYVEVEGKQVKPSSCYYFGDSPAHILYNTNCPEMLRHTIEDILQKYITDDDEQGYRNKAN